MNAASPIIDNPPHYEDLFTDSALFDENPVNTRLIGSYESPDISAAEAEAIEYLDFIFGEESKPSVLSALDFGSSNEVSSISQDTSSVPSNGINRSSSSFIEKVMVKTKMLSSKDESQSGPLSASSAIPYATENSLVATYKFLCRIGYVFNLKKKVYLFISSPPKIVTFLLWISFVFLCYNPYYLLFVPSLLGFSALMFHRLHLTKYKYSSNVSFNQITNSFRNQVAAKKQEQITTKLTLSNYSLLKNIADLNDSTLEFLEIFDTVVRALEDWMNEPPEVTYSKWLTLVFSVIGIYLITLLLRVSDFLVILGTGVWLGSHRTIRHLLIALYSTASTEWIKPLRPANSHTLTAPQHRQSLSKIKLLLFRIVHAFLTMRLLDRVFHKPEDPNQDFDLDPRLFE